MGCTSSNTDFVVRYLNVDAKAGHVQDEFGVNVQLAACFSALVSETQGNKS